jgi:hypothetical protein
LKSETPLLLKSNRGNCNGEFEILELRKLGKKQREKELSCLSSTPESTLPTKLSQTTGLGHGTTLTTTHPSPLTSTDMEPTLSDQQLDKPMESESLLEPNGSLAEVLTTKVEEPT